MKKAERLKQNKEAEEKLQSDQIRQRTEELGLNFVATELPPDDVDEKDVERSIYTSLVSMVPYSNAWYEARAAEDEMDDLKKIKIEKVKAADLLTMSKMGRHDEALDRMMSETNYDFFYFNKLKTKMIAEGKFVFDENAHHNPFGGMEKGVNRNRLKKAVNANHNSLDESMTQELARLSTLGAGGANSMKKHDRDLPCIWRGKNKNGEPLKCTNSRVVRVKQGGKKTAAGPEMEAMQWCSFHNPVCTGEVHLGETAAENEAVRVKIPNSEGLCSECYMIKLRRKPIPLSNENCPGVVLITTLNNGKSAKYRPGSPIKPGSAPPSSSGGYVRKKKPVKCAWVPNSEATRPYECNNELITDPRTKQKMSTCGYHVTKCMLVHPGGGKTSIDVPNIYGLCSQHFLATHGEPAVETPFPYPNMGLRKAKDFWKSAGAGGRSHWAAPVCEPCANITISDYYEPEKPTEFVAQMIELNNVRLFRKRRRKEGKECATIIQRFYRRYTKLNTHKELAFAKARKRRLRACIQIQTHMRRFLCSRYMTNVRLAKNNAARNIQRVYRGWRCRVRLRIDWAARRIARFMKKLHFFKFKDAVIMIMQLRLMARKQHRMATFIQRVFRGHSCRIWVFNKRLWMFICVVSARKIQRFYKAELARRALIPFVYPGEDWVLRQCAKRLSKMLLELFTDRARRNELALLMQESAPNMQRLVRAFLAKAGSRKMAFLRKGLRTWFSPQYAGEFMESFLAAKLTNYRKVEAQFHREPPREKACFVRAFLPELMKTKYEVPQRVFEASLAQWYHSKNIPLVKSEMDAIRRKFRNPMNGHVFISQLDEFIAAHKLPCRKHGRTVCGDCVLRKDCMLGSCHCKCFVATGVAGKGICVTCNHPGTLHMLVPTQTKERHKGKKPVMLQIMNTERTPDMSLPTAVKGVLVQDVIIPPPDPDVIRLHAMRAQKKETLSQTIREGTAEWTLAKTLSKMEIEGDNITHNVDYWKQHAHSVVNLPELQRAEATNKEPFVYEAVAHDNHAPDYKVSSSDFWSLTSKNPVKTVRDYHEKFDHNMPVPIVSHGEIVYSFEGPKLYFNILNQIIALGDKKVHHDDPTFLRLVVDHIQVFERHWRKFVVDIRQGKLDRNLQVSEESKIIFESTNLPRPLLAKQLDHTFRELGFHKKVLGKDIVIQPYAELRHPPSSASSSSGNTGTGGRVSRPASRARKGSEPNLKTGELLSNTQSSSRAQSPERVSSANKLSRLRPLSRSFMSRPSSPDGLFATSRPGTAEKGEFDQIEGVAGGTASRPNTSNSTIRKSMNKRDILVALGKTFKEHAAEAEAVAKAVSRPSTRETKRRGSQSDAQRPATGQELNEMHYGQNTAPRDNYKHALQTDGDRFVCPFPACGKSFHSKDAAFRHLPVHEQRTRLYAPTPLPDSHLSFYWPEGVPWHANVKYAQRAIPPGSLKCTHPGCVEAFTSQAQLDSHLRLIHMRVNDSSETLGYFKLEGDVVNVPPNPPQPESIPLRWCQIHTLPTGKCPVCVEIEGSDEPKPPFKFYDAMTVDFRAKTALHNMNSGGPKSTTTPMDLRALQKVRLAKDDWHRGVVVSIKLPQSQQGGNDAMKLAVKSEYRGRPLAVMSDRNRNGWLAIELLFTHTEAIARGLVIPHNTHKRYELVQPILLFDHMGPRGQTQSERLTEEEVVRRYFHWVPLNDVVRSFVLHKMTKEKIDHALGDGNISKLNTFYVRND